MTDLTEEVARALDDAWNGEHEAAQDLPPIEFTDAERKHFAQAAIAIVLERAAGVAERECYDRVDGARIAHLILALSPNRSMEG